MRLSPALLAVALVTAVAPTRASAACSSSLPVPADPRAAQVSCTGVHVGMELIVPSQKWGDFRCGASYAFTDQFGTRYLTFPGSCFLDYKCLEDTVYEQLPPPLNELVPRVPVCIMPSESEGEPTYGRNGPVVKDSDGRRVGTIVYAVNKDGVDFALLRVDANLKLDHSVPFYGGPTKIGVAGAIEEGRVFSPENGPTTNARAALLYGNEEVATVVTESLFGGTMGTSAMRTNGEAIGFTRAASFVEMEVQPLGEAIERASGRTRLKLRLMTAPLKK